jgi:hypothetical protein
VGRWGMRADVSVNVCAWVCVHGEHTHAPNCPSHGYHPLSLPIILLRLPSLSCSSAPSTVFLCVPIHTIADCLFVSYTVRDRPQILIVHHISMHSQHSHQHATFDVFPYHSLQISITSTVTNNILFYGRQASVLV